VSHSFFQGRFSFSLIPSGAHQCLTHSFRGASFSHSSVQGRISVSLVPSGACTSVSHSSLQGRFLVLLLHSGAHQAQQRVTHPFKAIVSLLPSLLPSLLLPRGVTVWPLLLSGMPQLCHPSLQRRNSCATPPIRAQQCMIHPFRGKTVCHLSLQWRYSFVTPLFRGVIIVSTPPFRGATVVSPLVNRE
jgi:hypothetical protein